MVKKSKNDYEYQLGFQAREDCINGMILPKLPSDCDSEKYYNEIYSIVEKYAGDDIEVLSLCERAVCEGKLERVLTYLSENIEDKGKALHNCNSMLKPLPHYEAPHHNYPKRKPKKPINVEDYLSLLG
jgi:hypothetical protein